MSEKSSDENLVLGSQINWPYILATSVLKFLEVTVKVEGEQSQQEIQEAAMVMHTLLPDQWVKADKHFKKEFKNVTEEHKIDTRPEWCGRKVGTPQIKKLKVVNPYKLAHACVNVFQRRGLLSKTIFTEKIVPNPEDFEETEQE